jgi:hypothetical protein
MLRKISIQFILTTFTILLLLIGITYYIFPEYRSFIMPFGNLLSNLLAVVALLFIIIVIFCISIVITKFVTQYVKK